MSEELSPPATKMSEPPVTTGSEISLSEILPLPSPSDSDITKVNTNVETKDESKEESKDDVVTAAEALALLTQKSSPAESPQVLSPLEQHPLVARVNQVSRHPLVTNAVRYYESSKRNYAPFNYAAGIVEKAAFPVVNKIEDNLNSRHRKRRIEEKESTDPRRPIDKEDHIETTKRLHFCLHILRLANDNISNKVNQLQQRMIDHEKAILEERKKADEKTKKADEQQTKTEIVATVRKIIHLISNFKPSLLGETVDEGLELKAEIRDIILQLPSTIQQLAIANGEQANDKVFLFARESLEMITKLLTVFSEQLERAESWMGDKKRRKD